MIRFGLVAAGVCAACGLALAADAGTAVPEKTVAAPKNFPVSSVPAVSPDKAAALPVAETWLPLMGRLAKDGVAPDHLKGLFGRLGDSYSHVPMGTKVTEIFTYKYMPRPKRSRKAGGTTPVYKGFVTPESVAKCKAYMAAHAPAFTAMEAAYGVPPAVVAGLLMVETRLGEYLGGSSSFWSLACLAAADSPERVATTVRELPLPMTPDKEQWLAALLRERSAWAYTELLALITHSKAQGLDPLLMPGSVYGAIGICQFMPSNLPKFAVDGNKDGKIDLFDPADAIPSVGNYLKQHGWKNSGRATRHAALKRYNKSTVYANTILALADAISPPPRKAGQDAGAGVKKSAGKRTPAKTAGKGTASR